MTNISNPFSLDCRQLPQKYTISTLYSANIADNQDSYGYIWKFTRFLIAKKEFRVNASKKIMSANPHPNPAKDFCMSMRCKFNKKFRHSHFGNDIKTHRMTQTATPQREYARKCGFCKVGIIG